MEPLVLLAGKRDDGDFDDVGERDSGAFFFLFFFFFFCLSDRLPSPRPLLDRRLFILSGEGERARSAADQPGDDAARRARRPKFRLAKSPKTQEQPRRRRQQRTSFLFFFSLLDPRPGSRRLVGPRPDDAADAVVAARGLFLVFFFFFVFFVAEAVRRAGQVSVAASGNGRV